MKREVWRSAKGWAALPSALLLAATLNVSLAGRVALLDSRVARLDV